ncbi:MAG: glucosamine-6-phosphate deaminase [Candidatus Falkowbacteria bacterium]
MKIINAKSCQEISDIATSIILKQIKKKKNSVLCLPTGKTPLLMYKKLVQLFHDGKISFEKVLCFNLDEYYGLNKENKNSYHYYMRKNFFNFVDAEDENIFILDGMAKNFKKECDDFEKKIKKTNGIDLMILGIGENGHIGFNEPEGSFLSRTRLVNLDISTRRANSKPFKSLRNTPKRALTIGLKTIMEAKQIILLASGNKKKNIVKKAFKDKINKKIPASILQTHKNVTAIIDFKI